ncbi:EamA family transporter [Atlantibacter subterraneus]|uniref:EamA family transporter n=1 Tax=Atlantibacter subterraneus TaxID=255519 RepID=UPI001184047E|nr:EamA family transporter [Atlantibacter subterranea]MDW2743482.1 EamA family transporter [Atlantibacter subterranea]TSJ58835.1 EamA family transporter [Atlantibacter subterranea]UTJ46544.1 EamA family transporter [Atlantibacter subterranea]
MSYAKKGMLYVLLAAIFWGSSGVAAQYIMEQSQISAPFLTMIRLLFSGFILLTLSFMQGDKIFAMFKIRRDAISLVIFSLFGALLVQFTFLVAIEKSNAATATILQFLSPTIIVMWFAAILKKRPSRYVIMAVATSLIGTFLLVTHGNPTSLSISGAALFWGIASAFAAAFYTTYPSKLIGQYGTLPIVGWSMLIGGAALLPFYSGQHSGVTINSHVLMAFFYLVVVGTALTFSIYLKGAQMIGGPKASILSCAEPLSSALLSLALLGISFTLPDWLGTLLILSSVALISLDSRRKVRPA